MSKKNENINEEVKNAEETAEDIKDTETKEEASKETEETKEAAADDMLPPPVILIFPLPRSSTPRTMPVLMRWSTPWWSCARASRPLRSAPLC